MRYFVIGPDGNKYGPADVPTLNQWVAEGRLLPTQMLEEEASGARIAASAVEGLNFPVQGAAQPGREGYAAGQPYQSNYARPGEVYGGDNGAKDLTTAWICAVLGVVCCGFIPIFGIVSANKAAEKGNPGAKAAKIVNIVILCLAICGGIFYAILIGSGVASGISQPTR